MANLRLVALEWAAKPNFFEGPPSREALEGAAEFSRLMGQSPEVLVCQAAPAEIIGYLGKPLGWTRTFAERVSAAQPRYELWQHLGQDLRGSFWEVLRGRLGPQKFDLLLSDLQGFRKSLQVAMEWDRRDPFSGELVTSAFLSFFYALGYEEAGEPQPGLHTLCQLWLEGIAVVGFDPRHRLVLVVGESPEEV